MIGGGYSPWFVEELHRRIEDDCTERARQLSQDMAEDFAAYRYDCGVIAGLRYALEFVDMIAKEQDQR